jgi:hypothetical protein
VLASLAPCAGAGDFFQADSQALLKRYCQTCHQGASPAGGIAVGAACPMRPCSTLPHRPGAGPSRARHAARPHAEGRRARDFAERFIDRWLNIRELGDIKPDEKLFPGYYDAELQSAIRYEPILFFSGTALL